MAPIGSGAKLREEDLLPGKAFVHPETRLEYEDFHAFLCGKDPLPHWRNGRVKELLAGTKGAQDEHFERRVAYFFGHYDRHGRSTFDFTSRTTATGNDIVAY